MRVDKLLLLLAGLSVGVAATLVLLTVRDSMRPAAIELVPPPPLPTFTPQPEPLPTATAGLLAIYVTGEVRFPAVYELPPDSLAAAAVEAAGGFTAAADPVAINLARRLADGMQLHVPARAETAPSPSAFSDAPPVVRSAPIDLFAGLVNINSATAAELEALPGIGPSLAARIIAHREENGPFVSVEALLDVSGIGEAKLEAILDLVTVSP